MAEIIRLGLNLVGTEAKRIALNTNRLQVGTIFEESDTRLIYKWSGTEWFKIIKTVNNEYIPFDVSDEFARPNNTSDYASTFVYTNATREPLVFENVVDRNGKACVLTDARITVSSAQTARPLFKLYIFNQSPTLSDDRTVLNLSIADANVLQTTINSIDVGINSTTTIITISNLSNVLQTANNDRNLYGCLQMLNVYTPTASEIVRVNLRGFLMN